VVAILLVASHGIVWVAATQLALMTTNLIVQMLVAHRVLGVSLWMFARSTRSAILAGAAMGVSIVALRHALPDFDSPARFFISVAIGSVTYIAVAVALERSLISEVADGLRSRVES
jgi:hypothetical protein